MSDWLELILRTLSAIVILFLVTKILGKRQLSELSLFEYITGITIGNLAASISTEPPDKWYQGVLSLGVWTFVAFGIEFIVLKSKRLRNLFDGKATILIEDGKIQEKSLKKERLTVDELMEQLRNRDVFSLTEVKRAILEQSGTLNILLKKENQPLTPKMLGVQAGDESMPEVVISDGVIMDDTLSSLGLTRNWLQSQIRKQGLKAEDIFVAQVNSYGQLYIDLYRDQIKLPQTQERDLLYALLKKCEADLELFSLSTKDKAAKKMYEQSARKLKQEISKLQPYLKA